MTKHEVRMIAAGIVLKCKNELIWDMVTYDKREPIDVIEQGLLVELRRFKIDVTEDEPIQNPYEGVGHRIL